MVEVNFIVFQLLTKLMEHDMWFNNNEKKLSIPAGYGEEKSQFVDRCRVFR